MTCKAIETRPLNFCLVNVSIKLLRPYFNQQFYIMLYGEE